MPPKSRQIENVDILFCLLINDLTIILKKGRSQDTVPIFIFGSLFHFFRTNQVMTKGFNDITGGYFIIASMPQNPVLRHLIDEFVASQLL